MAFESDTGRDSHRAATVREWVIAAAGRAELKNQGVKPANPARLLTRAALYVLITGRSRLCFFYKRFSLICSRTIQRRQRNIIQSKVYTQLRPVMDQVIEAHVADHRQPGHRKDGFAF